MTQLITSAQTLTTSFADLGSAIPTAGLNNIGLWLNVDINDAQNVRVRALAQLTQAGGTSEEYSLPIKVVSASDVKVEDEYYEFNVDADQQIILGIQLNGIIPWVQFQAMMTTDGGVDAQIDAADWTNDNHNSFK